MPKSTLILKSTVTRRQAAPVPSDMAERQQQAEYHQAAEDARQTVVEAATATPEEPSGKDRKQSPHAVQAAFLSGNLGKPVTVFTIYGLRLTGKLRQFDQFTFLLEVPDGGLLAFRVNGNAENAVKSQYLNYDFPEIKLLSQ